MMYLLSIYIGDISLSTDLAIQGDTLGLSHLSATICAELAAGLIDAEGVKDKYKLSELQWRKLKGNLAFRAMLKDAIGRLTGDVNAGKRIMIKSEILLEDSLPVLHDIIQNKEGSSQSKIDSVKQLTILARKDGKGEAAGMAGHGFNVQIHINTGEGKEAEPRTIIEMPVDD